MKKIFLSLIVAMVTVTVFAQTNESLANKAATLTHGDQISMFYGANAFQDAHDAAENGDVINLSGGEFQSMEITKALTIRGTGIKDSHPTKFGRININIPSDVKERLSFEGCICGYGPLIEGTLKKPYFFKCSLNFINGNIEEGLFADCDITECYMSKQSSASFYNCHIKYFNNEDRTSPASFTNCLIEDFCNFCIFENCIFLDTYNNFPSASFAINSLFIDRSELPKNGVLQDCQCAKLDIFQGSDPANDFTDEAKSKYLGTDGTPVGLYGGILPYNMTPSYPQITKMNVANKTTVDGKLSVEIEVKAGQ